jgi:hypothetical protein
MYKILPYPKIKRDSKKKISSFKSLIIKFEKCDKVLIKKIMEVLRIKLGNFESLNIFFDLNKTLDEALEINMKYGLEYYSQDIENGYKCLFKSQGYVLNAQNEKIDIYFNDYRGAIYSISTLKQIIYEKEENSTFYINDVFILDYPEIENRSLSTTFTWYAGYGRVGFDMQLWGFEQWKDFLELCSDYKITQLNLCMYGYWPFEFKDFPETTFKDFKMKVWNRESKNWLEIKYTHPNLTNPFFLKLIEHAHLLGINIYAYIGLNSYNGGYSNIYKNKRMKLPPNSKYINDFDTLCLSNNSTIEYLKKSVRRITELGIDGIVFEESEEAYWFCNCEKCKERFLNTSSSPTEAKHNANYWLLDILYKEIKDVNPNCNIGLRAWREPPLEKDIGYLKKCKESIPEDVCLYWAPGLYVNEKEFEKWVSIFGKERIYARDTEANAVYSCTGRLIRIFRNNILRPDDETNHQHIENDIRQHKGSARLKVKGINGYLFEFYGFFMYFFVHANYGWDSKLEKDEFYDYSIEAVFGNELKNDILYIINNLFIIHESQINIFGSEFPFLRNKVRKDDIPVIHKAQENWPKIEDKIIKVKNLIKSNKKLNIYFKHFEKIENSHRRNKEIYELCLNAVKYDNATSPEDKIKYIKLIDYYNERDYNIAKELFFDIGIIDASGIRDSMFPYHELKRVTNNILNPDFIDEKQIYLGVEALGWLWL